MTRRHWLYGFLAGVFFPKVASAQGKAPSGVEPLRLSDADWKKRLTPAQYNVLREEGTERPFTSPFNTEKRKGRYLCVACDLPLFSSEAKFDSGTGWPSFHTALAGAFTTRTDYKIVFPRTEYRCARCDGHLGHVFPDGPGPEGLRYCMNSASLDFVPKD